MSFNKPTGCGNRLKFIQIGTCICKKTDILVFDFLYNCDLAWRSRSSIVISKCRAWWFFSLCYHTKFERNWSVNVWIQANIVFNEIIEIVFNEIIEMGFSPMNVNEQDKMSMRFITPTSLSRVPSSIHIDWNLCEWHRNFCFLALLWPWIKVKVS